MKKNKILRFFLVAVILFTLSCSKEETVRVSGRVIDSISNNPIEGAEVELYCQEGGGFNWNGADRTGEKVVYTDENGYFAMVLVANCESATVVVTKQGYKSKGLDSYTGDIDIEKENILEVKMEPCDSYIDCF
ncbi:MAG: carboxypeptidase-like regulatory domain-containing protein [Flavobacteriales bacterium]